MKIVVYHVKSFTKNQSRGTPTGIVPDADNLSDEQLLQIAKKLSYSESAFIQKSEKANYKNRFFSPEKEISLCAHATLAAFHILIETKKLSFENKKELSIVQETLAGILPVTGYRDGLIVMTQKNPEFFTPEKDRRLVAHLIGVSSRMILNQTIQVVSTGTPKLIVPIVSLDALMKIQPNLEEIKEYCRKTEARGVYCYTTETIDSDSDFHARQFNPLAGINEDPITGVAAGALGAYIRKYKLSNKTKFTIEQGYKLNKAGKMIVDVSSNIKVGGYCVTVEKEEVEI
jgi:PhzF family phenazine biosynthesis protein